MKGLKRYRDSDLSGELRGASYKDFKKENDMFLKETLAPARDVGWEEMAWKQESSCS